MSSTRTPDPTPGWLSDEELAEIRHRLPLLYVEAVPVRLDGMGEVTEVGLLLRVSNEGAITRALVSGRVMFGETLRDALYRHLEKDLGPMALRRARKALYGLRVACLLYTSPSPRD